MYMRSSSHTVSESFGSCAICAEIIELMLRKDTIAIVTLAGAALRCTKKPNQVTNTMMMSGVIT